MEGYDVEGHVGSPRHCSVLIVSLAVLTGCVRALVCVGLIPSKNV